MEEGGVGDEKISTLVEHMITGNEAGVLDFMDSIEELSLLNFNRDCGDQVHTPLFLMFMKCSYWQVVEHLIDRSAIWGIDVDITDSEGFTCLHLAALYGRLETARALLKAGAKTYLTNVEGNTAIDIAIAKGHHSIADLLRNDYKMK